MTCYCNGSTVDRRRLPMPRCYCEREAELRLLKTEDGKNRVFYLCPASGDPNSKPCEFFKWGDGLVLQNQHENRELGDDLERSIVGLKERLWCLDNDVGRLDVLFDERLRRWESEVGGMDVLPLEYGEERRTKISRVEEDHIRLMEQDIVMLKVIAAVGFFFLLLLAVIGLIL